MSVVATNIFLWILLVIGAVATFGGLLLVAIIGWIVNQIAAEYNVRKLQSRGVTVSPMQFTPVHEALQQVCGQFGMPVENYRTIILPSGEGNAFAIKFARKRVFVILTELLDGIIDEPEQLRALLGHELCHMALDHGARGIFERYKPAAYKAARELTCDNAGLAAAGDLESARLLIRKLHAGKHLHIHISDESLKQEARFIESGFTGWMLKQSLTYPPAGARIENIESFAQSIGCK